MTEILEACRKTGPMDERLVRGTVESSPRNSEEYTGNPARTGMQSVDLLLRTGTAGRKAE